MLRSAFLLLLAVLVPAAVFAQEESEGDDEAASAPVASPTSAAAAVAVPDDGAAIAEIPGQPLPSAAPDPKKQARLQKIAQLQFDRRPSAILKAWSGRKTPPPKKPAGNAPAESTEPQPAADPFDAQLEAFRENVTLGKWDAVKSFLASLSTAEGKAAYAQMLRSMQNVPRLPLRLDPEIAEQFLQMAQNMGAQQGQQHMERHSFSLYDLVALADVAPGGIDDDGLTLLAGLIRTTVDKGQVVEQFGALLKEATSQPVQTVPLTRRQAAKLLLGAGQPVLAGDFLPDLAFAEEQGDQEALNLLARHYLGQHAKDAKAGHLERAWRATQSVLASAKTDAREKEEALVRSVDLASKLRRELGQAWLDKSFTDNPERGREILSAIGAASSGAMQSHTGDTEFRLKHLQLQSTAVETLLKASPERAAEWRRTLALLAGNWLQEAIHSYKFDKSKSLGPEMQRDMYGNYYFWDDYDYMRQNRMMMNMAEPLNTGKLLDVKPGEKWISLLDDGLRPKFDMISAQLYLKVAEDELAFPHIEKLAASHPTHAKSLVDEFLRVWTQNHDPNSSRRRTNPYMFMYGFERRSEGIPLTRSKQERNLEELSEHVARINALKLGRIDEQLLASAFTACHSSAEVYRLEAIAKVFGSLDSLKPETLAELAQQMRGNLISVWRQPAVQEQNKTKRKQKDIQAEVLRGYQVAQAVVADALTKHPNEWTLVLASAALAHDENNYRGELAFSSDFSKRREEALARFAEAARLYAAKSPEIPREEQTTKAFELWFYAAMGACDLEQVDEKTLPDLKQPAMIRTAIESLPVPSAETHMGMFASSLVTRMSAVKPAVKARYLKHGFEIVGDHRQAHEARKLHDYYHDLVSELKLECAIDGTDVVGHSQPFGVFVNLRHTREIERESGGFGRYLQNQNTGGNFFYYNYGRPLENYRDKFETMARKALEEHFDILSVTFQTEKVTSRATPEYGWRVTPYAYLLLKAKGKEVDKLPPMQLHLDFLDTSGYVVLPIESPAVPIDASPENGDARPVKDLAVTQILDERQSDEGKLLLEIKATGHGLIPPLESLLDVKTPGFTVASVDDKGVAVSKFDPDADESLIVAERMWMVTLKAEEGQPARPAEFHFASPKSDEVDVTLQRYADADLVKAESVVPLEAAYGEPKRAWIWPTVSIAAAVLLLAGFWYAASRRPKADRVLAFRVPEDVNAFTVLGLLRDIERNNGMAPKDHQELATEIHRLERHYFAPASGDPPNLAAIAEGWVGRASNGR